MKAELVEVKLPDHSDVSLSYSCMNTKHITISKKWQEFGRWSTSGEGQGIAMSSGVKL